MIERTYYAAKGGQGVTTVAVADAVIADLDDQVVWLVTDQIADACAVAGIPFAPVGESPYVGLGSGRSVVMTAHVYDEVSRRWPEPDLVIHDAGVTDDPSSLRGEKLLVTRACYLALRRASRHAERPDGVVFVVEPDRALGAEEVADVIGRPIVLTIPAAPEIARSVDAGLMGVRPPAAICNPLAGRLRPVAGGTNA